MKYPHEVIIQNVVSSTQLSDGFDLDKLDETFVNAKYQKHKFPGLIYKTKSPDATFLFFESGKIVCTGTKHVNDTIEAIKQMIGFLSDKGYDVFHQPEVYVQNVVASTYVKQKLNLNAIAIGFDLENVEYEPEQFPGLVYRLGDPHVVTLMFSSGKVVITGGKCPEDCIEGMDAVYERLYKLGLVDNG